ncbi:MAG: crotonase/enoyl-CoA hydratase family protein [Polyangiales bacterium]
MPIRVEVEGEICCVTIERPQRKNAVDRAHAEELAAAFRTFDADPTLKVAILTGAEGVFCAGADLKAVHEGNANRLEALGDGPMGPSRMMLTKPVIAAIAGHAVAGGLELALWCDLRVAEEDAVLGVFCRRWGVPLIDGGTVRLPALIGLSRALDLMLTGRPVEAEEALGMGLVNRVVAKGQALAEARLLAKTIAAFPQACMRSDRASAYGAIGLPLSDAIAQEFVHGQGVFEEMKAGVARFSEGAGRGGRFDD